MKTKVLLDELEKYIFVILKELKEFRPKDYEVFHSLFPSVIPKLDVEWTKEDKVKIFQKREEIVPELLKQTLQSKEFLLFIEEVFSTRYYKETDPETFWPDKFKNEVKVQPTKVINDFDPSLIQMAKNFGTAMLDSAKTGFKKVTPEQHAERMAICNTCQFWDGKARMGMGKCAKCGCTGAKQWLSSSSCPINLWGSLP